MKFSSQCKLTGFKSFVRLLGYSSRPFSVNILVCSYDFSRTSWLTISIEFHSVLFFLWLVSKSSLRKSGFHLLPRSSSDWFSIQCLLAIMSDSLQKYAHSQKWKSISNIECCSINTTKMILSLCIYSIFSPGNLFS